MVLTTIKIMVSTLEILKLFKDQSGILLIGFNR